MLAIDTNLIVHYLAGDHPEQSRKARALIDGKDVFVCTTVLLETEWMLRNVYGLTALEVASALAAFAGLANVTLEDAPLIAKALDWAGRGIDFADALHLAKAEACDAMVTVDRGFARVATKLSNIEVRLL